MKRQTGQVKVQIQRARLLKAQAEIKELAAAQLRGELVPITLVRVSFERICGAFRSRLLALPRKAVPDLRRVSADGAREKILREMIHDALNELADSDFAGIVEAAARSLKGNGASPKAGNRDEAQKKARGKGRGRSKQR